MFHSRSGHFGVIGSADLGSGAATRRFGYKGDATKMSENIARRDFVRAAGMGAATVAGAALVTGALADEAVSAESADWLPVGWDKEADIVIIGYGNAGICAAITTTRECGCSAIVLEVAPQEYEGGISRISGNIVFIPDDPESAITYQSTLDDQYPVDAELQQAWAEAICENKEWIESLGCTMEQVAVSNPDFPELAGADKAHVYCVDGHFGDQSLWNVLKAQEAECGYEVVHEARVTKIVRNPLTNEALGVVADNNGTEITVKAHKAVIVCCGGYENNPELLRNTYDAGTYRIGFFGTPYNRGDGFKLVAPFGAQIWHTNAFSGPVFSSIVPEVTDALMGTIFNPLPYTKDYIFIGKDATRFMYEELSVQTKHGKLREHGAWCNAPAPQPTYMIFGKNAFEAGSIIPSASAMGFAYNAGLVGDRTNEEWLEAGLFKKGETIEELAEQIGMDPTALKETVETYNQYCDDGYDPDFHRGEPFYDYGFSNMTGEGGMEIQGAANEKTEVIAAFDLEPLEPPFYAMEIVPCLINTQGGAKRDVHAQIVDMDNNPIPRLFGAGEFGSIYGYLYNGGGDVSEAVATGRLAAREACKLENWE